MNSPGYIRGGGPTIPRETIGEFVGEWIEAVRKAILAQAPDRDRLGLVHRIDHRIDRREIVLPTPVDERPRHTLTSHGDAEPPKQLVIFVRMSIVLRFLDEAAPAFVLPAERGTLEAGQKEGREDSRSLGHGYMLQKPCRWAERRGGDCEPSCVGASRSLYRFRIPVAFLLKPPATQTTITTPRRQWARPRTFNLYHFVSLSVDPKSQTRTPITIAPDIRPYPLTRTEVRQLPGIAFHPVSTSRSDYPLAVPVKQPHIRERRIY